MRGVQRAENWKNLFHFNMLELYKILKTLNGPNLDRNQPPVALVIT